MVDMPESVQIIISVIIVVLVYILTLMATGWWTKRVSLRIIKELESKGAVNASTAISLPYAKSKLFNLGYRDYRPKALEALVMHGVVCKTFNDQYYLDKEKISEHQKMAVK